LKLMIHAGTARGFGSRAVCKGAINGLAKLATQHEIHAFIPEVWWRDSDFDQSRLPGHMQCTAVKAGVRSKFALENIQLRQAIKRWPADVLFSMTDTSVPHIGTPHMLLVQQAYLAYHPDAYGFRLTPAWKVRFALMSAYLKQTLRTTDIVTVQTQSMKRRFSERFQFPEDRVAVIPSAVTIPTQTAIPCGLDNVAPYVTYVASAAPHKNHVVLAPMMAALADQEKELTCRITVTPESCPELAKEAKRLGVLDRFVFEGPVPPERAITLMRHAKVVLMPSKLESFGLPFYEAMSIGTPVVCANRDFAREACGDAAALYADPDDGAAFAAHICDVIASETVEKKLSEAGKIRSKEIQKTWLEVSASYLQLIETRLLH
jgi:glycosyltransferase involved in cell wall biosynthesis